MTRAAHFRGLAFAVLVGAACSGDPSPTSSASPTTTARASWFTNDPSLIQCPSNTTQRSSGIIGPLGGILAVGNTQVIIPANAVLDPTSFTLTVPASKYVELDVDAAGTNHYVFALPVTVVIDYSRCSRSNLLASPLTAWNIDPDTKAMLEEMPSIDNKLLQTVTFSTIHFSGYAVAD